MFIKRYRATEGKRTICRDNVRNSHPREVLIVTRVNTAYVLYMYVCMYNVHFYIIF